MIALTDNLDGLTLTDTKHCLRYVWCEVLQHIYLKLVSGNDKYGVYVSQWELDVCRHNHTQP